MIVLGRVLYALLVVFRIFPVRVDLDAKFALMCCRNPRIARFLIG